MPIPSYDLSRQPTSRETIHRPSHGWTAYHDVKLDGALLQRLVLVPTGKLPVHLGVFSRIRLEAVARAIEATPPASMTNLIAEAGFVLDNTIDSPSNRKTLIYRRRLLSLEIAETYVALGSIRDGGPINLSLNSFDAVQFPFWLKDSFIRRFTAAALTVAAEL